MTESETGERDIDAIIRQVQQQMPEVKVRQWHKTWPADDDNLWWFSLPGIEKDVHVEGAACPFLIETDEQDRGNALKAATTEDAATLILTYLRSVKEGQPAHLSGPSYWPEQRD